MTFILCDVDFQLKGIEEDGKKSLCHISKEAKANFHRNLAFADSRFLNRFLSVVPQRGEGLLIGFNFE